MRVFLEGRRWRPTGTKEIEITRPRLSGKLLSVKKGTSEKRFARKIRVEAKVCVNPCGHLRLPGIHPEGKSLLSSTSRDVGVFPHVGRRLDGKKASLFRRGPYASEMLNGCTGG